jgi:hypothetical protein
VNEIDYQDPYSMFLFAMRSPKTREKCIGRLRMFFDFLDIVPEESMAQNENKKIIPCIQIEINYADIKWGLNIIQGIEFNDKYDLARKLYSRILKIRKQVKDVTGTKALTLPVPDKLKEEMPQPTNQLKN